MDTKIKKKDNHMKVYRNEIKYYISCEDYQYLRSSFKKIMHMDENCKENKEYWIRSLYFDTVLNDDYYDKQVGVKDRKKIRLRIYSLDQENVKLEIKNKFNQYMLKETSLISRGDSMKLIDGNRDVLLKYNDNVLNKVFYYMSKDYYRPSIIIDYEREAYTYPIENIRITFDKNVRANIVDFNIFNPHLNFSDVFDTQTVILEVKYNKFLPHWIKGALSQIHGDKDAISKYCKGRMLF